MGLTSEILIDVKYESWIGGAIKKFPNKFGCRHRASEIYYKKIYLVKLIKLHTFLISSMFRGQLISKYPFGVFKSTIKPTKSF